LRELEAAKGDVVEHKDSVGGVVTIGVIPTVAPYLLPAYLTTFSRKFPQARLTVVEEITPVLLDRLRAGTIDVAILALPIRGHEFAATALLTEPLFAALPPKHKLASRRSLSLKDLRSEPFLLLRDGHCFRDTAVAACDRARLNPQIIFESGQFSSLLSMVAAEMGVSIVPEMAIEKSTRCRYVKIADASATRTIAALVLRGRSLSRAHLGFLEHLRDSSAVRTARR
jgi:LysR family hydrogen peroxide-inducible transcriptional activator